jgi:MoaA/NifB/PqqE/SkfB family radical SAM enzyme
VTDPCNLRCTHCYDADGSRRKELSPAEALQAVDRLADAGFGFVVFSGGEPLLRKDLFALLGRCRERGLGTALRSNGTLVSPARARELVEVGVAVVGVSLDGAIEETHDAVRGRGALRRSLAGIVELLSAGARVNVEVVLSKRNAGEALGLVALAEELGVHEVNFSAVAPQGRARHLPADLLDHDAWRGLTSTLRRASRNASVPVSPSCALAGPCVACVEPNLTCEGWVTPCYLSSRRLFHLLQTPPERVWPLLREARRGSLDGCGRRAWTEPPRGRRSLPLATPGPGR